MTRYIEAGFSKDGGYTFTDFRKAPLPDEGDYGDAMPVWRRLGIFRQASARFRCTEACTLTIIAMEVEAE